MLPPFTSLGEELCGWLAICGDHSICSIYFAKSKFWQENTLVVTNSAAARVRIYSSELTKM